MNARRPLRTKIMLVVLATTLGALVMSAAVALVYELLTYRSAWVDDISSQAELVARASATALTFDDPKAAAENLSMLRLRPQIRAAAVYTPDGKVFAQYAAEGASSLIPEEARGTGAQFEGDALDVFVPVVHNHEVIGSVYLAARHDVTERLTAYGVILCVVTLVSLGLSALIFNRLQHRITRPIVAVAAAARELMANRDYALRVPRTSDDEVGDLVEAFNGMVGEVGRRTAALEQLNHDLSVEMLERQRAEDALRAADRRKDEFLATLAHELRNPLAPLSNGLEILRLADTNPVAAQRTRDIMQRQLRQMVRLIDDLLELSRISTGKLTLRREPLDLRLLLEREVEAIAPTLKLRGHELSVHLPDRAAWVNGDAARLSQVFANLLSNAVKYTDPEGLIELDAKVSGHNVVVDVSDNGIGIAPQMQQAVFEMFMQVDRSLERGRAGLGLGLTLARQLVDMHGGEVRVFSPGLGLGSRFTVTLPLSAPETGAPSPAPQAGVDPGPPLDVLVADDNIDFAVSLSHLLTAQGHRVRVVHDGQAAWEQVLARAPDAAFLDIGMPGLNGYDLAERLRKEAKLPGLVLVAITGWGQESDRARARAAGFDHHLVKPVELAQVLAVLR